MVTSSVIARSPIDDKESARVFVQQFYDWYAVMDADDGFTRKHNASPFAYTVKYRQEYFEIQLNHARPVRICQKASRFCRCHTSPLP